ncbi:glycosyltransferase family 39 protein [Anaeromyxobacter sp. Fw109-5]|uniref:glycosyltransferase family 39 protein n=1 Tax=Anaeromyxobacter sp. (strain Fw109-5) TaxID=404589 RepID=UPI0000ED6D0A|nr:glycosyltransferase family 39 protein [Anaeromyxobacter sp. Fw109-5]ABS28371.1 conserved hypothetical protein [Anaeromyxobacter sp. Fw109-5]
MTAPESSTGFAAASPSRDAGAAPGRATRLVPAALALATFALHAACGGRYGIFRDELYFIACGERLAWGYVDQPPGIAVVARAAHAISGTWVPGLRLLPWLASAATVFLAGRLAVRLGGGAFAAALAGVAVALSPMLAALGHLLTMNAFEPLAMVALACVLVRCVQGGSPRPWLLAGVLVAAGALLKYTSVLLAASLVAGLLATSARRALATRWALAGAALGAALVLPNLLWQAAHGFPFLELVRNGQLSKNAPFALASFARSLLLEPGPLAAPVWLGGLGWLLLAEGARPHRFLGLGGALYLALLVATRGKAYYAAPALPILLAAGGVASARALRRGAARAAALSAVAITSAIGLPLALPLLPVQTFVRYQAALGVRPEPLERKAYGALPQHFADQHGWEALAAAVADVSRRLPAEERARAAVFAQNYGQAAALEVHGPRRGLSLPVISGHNQYFLWGPPAGGADPLLVVSDEREDCGGGLYRERTLAARLPSSPWVMPYEDARWIWICRGATRPLAPFWPAVRHYE